MTQRPLAERVIPALIIPQSVLQDYPLYMFETNNKELGSLKSIEDSLKATTGYKWGNHHHFIQSTLGGHLFAFSVYYSTQERPTKFYHWDISIWDETGGTALGLFQIAAVDKETDKLSNEDFKQIMETCNDYTRGIIICGGCHQKISRDEIAGQYFAARYCKICWETKYKAIEARETYE